MGSTFETLVAELTRDANRARPQDALQWCSNWFQQRLEAQRARIRGELARLPALRTSLPKDHSVDTPIQSNRQPTENLNAGAVSQYSRAPPGYRPPLANLRGPRPFGTLNPPGNTLLEGDAEGLLDPTSNIGPNTPVGPMLSFGLYSRYQNKSPGPGQLSPQTTSSIVFARRSSISTGSIAVGSEITETPPGFPGTAEQLGRMRISIGNGFIFRDLDEEQETWVLNAMQEMRVEADEVVIRQGDVGEYLSVVESGHLDYGTPPEPLPPSWLSPQSSLTSLPPEVELLQPDSLTAQPPSSSSVPPVFGPTANSFIDQRLLHGVCKSLGATWEHVDVDSSFPRSTRVQPTSGLQH